MRKAPLTLQKQGFEETPQSKSAENADSKTRKRQKMRMTGFNVTQRKRDDNKNKNCAFQVGVGRGAGREIIQNAIFHGKRHDKKNSKMKILLSRNFVVMAQAPSDWL